VIRRCDLLLANPRPGKGAPTVPTGLGFSEATQDAPLSTLSAGLCKGLGFRALDFGFRI
jgi:hypothetical protein